MNIHQNRMRLSLFHMLPSGGGARVVEQNLALLQERFDWSVHRVEPAVEIPVPQGVETRTYPFPRGGRLRGAGRLFAPWALHRRLRGFRGVCRVAAEAMNSWGGGALVQNSMVIAAPPVLDYLKVPSIYFCFEYPRHLYEKSVVRRTGTRLGEWLLYPLERAEKREDAVCMSRADRVVTFSPYMRGRLREIYGVEADMVFPGVDTRFFHPLPAPGAGSHLLSVGALWPFKGHEDALRAVARLPLRSRPPLVIVADREFPGYARRLEHLAEHLGVRLELLRGIRDETLRDLYRNALAVLCFQHREPYGLIPLEAMACGRPVIARDSGGFRDNVLHGETGLLFRNGVEEAADLMERILQSPAEGERLGTSGRAFVCAQRTSRLSAGRLAACLDQSRRL